MMGRATIGLATIMMVFSGPPGAAAQATSPPLTVGDHVRVRTLAAPEAREGELIRLREDVLHFRWGAADVVDRIPLTDIRVFERRLERSSHWLPVGIGGGAVGGFLTGWLAHMETDGDGTQVTKGALIGGAVGFGLGALLGRTWISEVWETLPVERLNGVRIGG